MIFYVYEHIRNDTAQVFYVGKGHGGRCHSKTGRNSHWHRIVNIGGFSVRKVVEDVEEDLAFLVEIERIDQLKRMGVRLCNQTDGGEGASGAKRSAETLAKMSAWQIGRKLPAETRAKLSAAHTGRKFPPEYGERISARQSGDKNHMFGKRTTSETKDKISRALAGIPKPQKIAVCPRCGVSGPANTMTRYHLPKCIPTTTRVPGAY